MEVNHGTEKFQAHLVSLGSNISKLIARCHRVERENRALRMRLHNLERGSGRRKYTPPPSPRSMPPSPSSCGMTDEKKVESMPNRRGFCEGRNGRGEQGGIGHCLNRVKRTISRLPLVVVTSRMGSKAGLLNVSALGESGDEMCADDLKFEIGIMWRIQSRQKEGLPWKRRNSEGVYFSRFGDIVEGKGVKDLKIVAGLREVLVT